jgi:ABC-type branched-subunit amino acid transport system ATPase component
MFERLTVVENVMTGAALKAAAEEKQRTRALEMLEFMGLAHVSQRSVSTLSYGQKRMVELCRALVTKPRVLLLDEPAAGLNLGEADLLSDRLIKLCEEHRLAIVLIEHNMGMVMRLAERIAVLNFGRKIAEGTPRQIQRDPVVLTAYLGAGYSNAEV